MTNEIQRTEKCSQCKISVKPDGKRYAEYMETLDILFPKVQNVISPLSPDGSSCITVTNLAGECANWRYTPEQTIKDLKNNVKDTLGIPCEQQMLLYDHVELKVRACAGACLHHAPL